MALAARGQLYPMVIAAVEPDPEQMFGEIQMAIAAYAEKYVPAEKCPTFPTMAEEPISHYRLKKTVRLLREAGYRVSVVIDEFHRISQSETLGKGHYDEFRRLYADPETHMRYVVATDSDFDPGNRTHAETFTTSFFVHIFESSFITAGGMNREECVQFLEGFLWEGETLPFSAEELERIYTLSGGIPELVRRAAKNLFDLKKGMGEETEFEKWILEDGRAQMQSWSHTLSAVQKALLVKAAGEGIKTFYEGNEHAASDILTKRGFFARRGEGATYGQMREKHFVCTLFRKYAEKYFAEEYAAIYGAEGQNLLGEEQLFVLELVRKTKLEYEEELKRLIAADRRVFATRPRRERDYEKLCKMEEKLAGAPLETWEIRTIEMECEKLSAKL